MSIIQWLSDKIGGGIVRLTRPDNEITAGGCPPKIYGMYYAKKQRRSK